MKKIFYAISIVIFTYFTVAAQQMPTLRGEEAVENLKQKGQYESLLDAVKAARRENGQTENVIGQWAKLKASDGATEDNFGNSVAISGDTAVVGSSQDDVGANNNQGSAYVFVRSGATWTARQKLTASDGAADDYFGSSVAIFGDTVIVGAIYDDVGSNSNQGSAYVFVRNGAAWIERQKLTAADGAAGDYFGLSVAISEDTVIIGASGNNAPNLDQGSAYVFVRNGVTWTQQQKLTASDGAAGDFFGGSIAISGDTAIISATYDDINNSNDQGSAYVFVRNGAAWTQQQKLIASDGALGDRFSGSVSISGDTIVIGAARDDVVHVDQGSAYVFVRNGAAWTQQQKLTLTDGAPDDFFGSSVVISGDTVIVTAPNDELNSNPFQGSAYVFTRSGTTWTQKQRLNASDSRNADFFGNSVAISGSSIIIGASGHEPGTATNQGAAYVFRFLSNDWTQESEEVAEDGAAGDNFGYNVAISGDTAIVGAYKKDVGANTDQGTAYVFVHSENGWTQQAKLAPFPSQAAPNDYFGSSVAIFGNWAIVGSPGDDVDNKIDQGSAYFFQRIETTWVLRQKILAQDGTTGDQFGSSVSINGNSTQLYAIIGVPGDDIVANADQGSAYVFIREALEWRMQAKITASDGAAGDNFGSSVSLSARTAIIGAHRDDIGVNGDQGSAYVFTLLLSTWTERQKLTASDGAAGDQFGNNVAINGDTAIVGAYQDTVGMNNQQGSAYVFFRSGATWTEQQKLTAADGAATDRFGTSVSISAEIAVIGAYADDVGTNHDQGSAYVFARSGESWTQIQKLTAANGEAGDQFGTSVSVSGDKIVVGSPFSDLSASDKGSAVFFNDFVALPPRISAAVFDFDGDGRSDVSVFRPSDGTWYLLRSTAGFSAAQWGFSTDVLVPGDYDGDLKTDIAVWRPSDGNFYILNSFNNTFRSENFGLTGDIPVGGDWDGDGKTDPAVYRPGAQSFFYYRGSMGNPQGNISVIPWGTTGDKPVAGDYDGDGRADAAVYRSGTWYVRQSSNGQLFATNFGLANDRVVPADYDADGKTDLAVYRSGVWYILRSAQGFAAFQFGISNDVPAPADYDGDGRADAAVFREGVWYILKSQSGATEAVSFGTSSDAPVPSAFVR